MLRPADASDNHIAHLTEPRGRIVPSPMFDPVDSYLTTLAETLDAVSRADIWVAVDMLLTTAQAGRRIYLIGNGGSAATASHLANDLNKQATVPGRPLFRAIALTDNVPLITAWANDADYAEVFAMQLANHVEEGDLVVAISTSGNSPNVLRALEVARDAGARSLGLTGDEGGALRDMVDHCLFVPSPHIGHQEDVHLALDHVLTVAIRAHLGAL
jgi:D-sedoheptulose 7-phosphate isomerase